MIGDILSYILSYLLSYLLSYYQVPFILTAYIRYHKDNSE